MTEPNYSRTFGADDAREIRDAVKRDLGKDAFRERPLRALWFIPMTAIIVGGIAAILTLGMPWWANLLVSLLVGHTVACQALLAHEVLHGALGLNRKMQNFLGWLGFGPALVPPEFWRRWHNIAHHANTNLHDKDPDSFGTMARSRLTPSPAFRGKGAPPLATTRVSPRRRPTPRLSSAWLKRRATCWPCTNTACSWPVMAW